MSRTKKGNKPGPGYDYQAKRAGNKGGCNCPARGVKRITNQTERAQRKQSLLKEPREPEFYPAEDTTGEFDCGTCFDEGICIGCPDCGATRDEVWG